MRHIMYNDPSGVSLAAILYLNGKVGGERHTAQGAPERGVIRVEHVFASGRLSGTLVSDYISSLPMSRRKLFAGYELEFR